MASGHPHHLVFRKPWMAAGLLLALFVGISLWAMREDSVTIDEFVFPPLGLCYLLTGDYLFTPLNPPLAQQLCALPMLAAGAQFDPDPAWRTGAQGWDPWLLGTKFMIDNAARYHQLFMLARLVPISLGVLLGLFVFLWAKELSGDWGGLLSLLLYVLCPNVLAHSRLATTDIAVTCFIFIASFCLSKLMRSPKWRYAIALGVSIGLALGSKFSAALLVVILPLQAAVLLMTNGNKLGALARGRKSVGLALAFVAVVALALLTLDATYGFRGLFVPLDEHGFESARFQRMARLAPGLRSPLPQAFLVGLDKKTAEADVGGFPGFLFGKWSDSGWRSFYAMSLLIKVPIGALVLAAISLLWWRRGGEKEQAPAIALAWIPLLVFVLYATLVFYRFNYGIRYILPVLPFLYLACGRAARLAPGPGARGARCLSLPARFLPARCLSPLGDTSGGADTGYESACHFGGRFAARRGTPGRRFARAMVLVMLAWVIYAAATIFPHHLSYFNEFVGGPRNGYKCMVDSNVDWGQDLKRLKGYMDRRGIRRIHLAYFGHVAPGIYGIDYIPLRAGERPSGPIAISVSLLQGLPYAVTYEVSLSGLRDAREFMQRLRPVGRDDFAWLRDRKPTARIGYSILVFEPDSKGTGE